MGSRDIGHPGALKGNESALPCKHGSRAVVIVNCCSAEDTRARSTGRRKGILQSTGKVAPTLAMAIRAAIQASVKGATVYRPTHNDATKCMLVLPTASTPALNNPRATNVSDSIANPLVVLITTPTTMDDSVLYRRSCGLARPNGLACE